MGLNSTVDAKVEGARGTHKIDVWAVGTLHGVKFKWLAECKDWKTNVPKEKVLALQSIVADVGADRGFLLSEQGFQSGAIRVASNTNVTLTSIADLQEAANDSIKETDAKNLYWRWAHLNERLWRLHKATDEEYFSKYIPLKARLMAVDMALKDALEGKFPTVYAVEESAGERKRLFADNWGEFVAKATALMDDVEAAAEQMRKASDYAEQ